MKELKKVSEWQLADENNANRWTIRGNIHFSMAFENSFSSIIEKFLIRLIVYSLNGNTIQSLQCRGQITRF